MPGPALVVMAAGIGSRYGGLKQIDPVGPCGEIIIDYSIYDALRAGFEKVIFVVRRGIEEAFREKIGRNIERRVETEYLFQDMTDLPEGFSVPEDRVKPWGTGHAVLAARTAVDRPFGVINADDFYGAEGFGLLAAQLAAGAEGEYVLVGFTLWNTLSDHGHVARGVCEVDGDGWLREIHERVHIEKFGEAVKYTEDGENWTELPREATVSMNMWGFPPNFLDELAAHFPTFLAENERNPKAEFFVPEVVGAVLRSGRARVRVAPTAERWFGVTYREDVPAVKSAIAGLVERGVYPRDLWGAG